VPNIVVVSAAPQQQYSRPAPVIVVTRTRGYRSFSIFGSLFTLLIIYGVYYYAMRMRHNVEADVNAAEHAAHGSEHSAPPPKKK
jgi:hypothetical protein